MQTIKTAKKLSLCALFLLLCSLPSFAQEAEMDEAYERRQKIDLGALTIDGEVVSPGDFSIEDEKVKESKFLYKRKNFNDRLRLNIQYVF